MFKPLDCDDDVLLFNKDTFTVGRVKELMRQNLGNKLNSSLQDKQSGYNILATFIKMRVGDVNFQAADIKWDSKNQDCKILRIGSKGWQKGKIRVQIIFDYGSRQSDVYLEFCPDEPTEVESPLDDLRQLPEYKNLSNPV